MQTTDATAADAAQTADLVLPAKPATAARRSKRKRRNRDGLVIEDLWKTRGHRDGLRWLVRVRDKAARRYVSKAYADEELEKGKQWAREQMARLTLGIADNTVADLRVIGREYLANLEAREPRPCKSAFSRLKVLLAELDAAGIHDLKAKGFRRSIEHYFLTLKTDRTRGSTGKTATSTKHARFRTLRTLVNFAIARDWLMKSPLKGLHLFTLVDSQRPTFTIEELRNVAALKRELDPSWLWVMVLMYTGLRREESLRLTWEDVNWNARHITVRRGKGLRSRAVPLQDELHDLLSPIGRPHGRPAATGAMFAASSSVVRSSWATFRNVLADAGVTVAHGLDPLTGVPHALSPHACRHTYAALQLATGMDSLHLQLALGHTAGDMTRHYAQQVAAYQRQVEQEGWPRGQFRLLDPVKVAKQV